jgi:ribosome recycling factor
MLQNEVSAKDLRVTFREMLSSVRDLNRRIDELKNIVKAGWCTEDSRKKVLERVAKLTDTKFCIIHSIYDIRLQVLQTFSSESDEKADMEEVLSLDSLYKDLKNI